MLVFALSGLFVGGFLNICIDRFPRGQSILSLRSGCDACGKSLSVLDRIPIFGYLALRGHCRRCGMRIPIRHLMVEIGTTLLFVLIWLRYAGTGQTALIAFYSSLLIVLLVIQLERNTVLDRVIYPAMAVALLFALWAPERTLPQMLAGGFIAFGTLLVIGHIFPTSKAMGVAKLAAFIGLALGYPYVWIALLMTLILGVAVIGTLVLAKRMNLDDPVAIGPFLAAGAIVAMLFGEFFMSLGAGGVEQIVRLLRF